MKKLIAIVLAMACVLCLFAGCVENPTPSNTTTTQKPTPSTNPSSTPAPSQPEDPEKPEDPNKLADGTYIFLNGNMTMAAVAESASYGYAPFNTVTVENGTVTGYINTDVITVTNVEGGITLQDCFGRYLYMVDPHNSFNVSKDMPTEGHIWTLTAVDGGYNLVNVMNGKTLAYSTQYTSWGVYAELNEDRNPLFTIVAAEPVSAPEKPALEGAPANGDKVYIYLPSQGLAISHIADGKKLTGAAATVADGVLTTEGAIFNVVFENGYYTFICGGKYLTTGETGNTLTLEYDPSEFSKWTLEPAADGFYLKSNAVFKGNAQYMEFYKNLFTTYSLNESNAAIYTFQFFKTDKEQEPFPPKPTLPDFDTELTIEQLLNLPLDEEEVTSGRYYVNGTVVSVTNSKYGEMIITDATGKTISIFNSKNADGTVDFPNMTDKPVKGDSVRLYCNVKNFGGTFEINSAYIQSVTHNPIDETQFTQMTIEAARNAELGTKVKITGVVARITYATGFVPSGVILVDATGSIYVYDRDLAQSVSIGNTVTVGASKTMWILESEQANASKYGYAGCNQLEDAWLLSNDNGTASYDKSWITETTMQELLNTPFTTDITTKIFKVTAQVKKSQGSGFVNYYFNDLDGITGSYAYTQCNGNDFAWLDAFDGKICTVYLMALNAKSTATGCNWRLLPIEVIDEGFDVSSVNVPENALNLFAMSQFENQYYTEFTVELLASVNNELLQYTDAVLTYVSADPSVLTFETVDGKIYLKTLATGTTTVTVTATHNGVSASKTVEITVAEKPKIEYVNVATAVTTKPGTDEAPVTVTVMGIVGPSLVNQSGFYLVDESGIIAVLVKDKAMLEGIELGQEVILTGIRFHKNKHDEGKTDFGQTCIKDAEIVINNGGKHDYSTKSFKGEITIEEFEKFDNTVDHTTEVYTMKVYVSASGYTTTLSNKDGSVKITLYASGTSQYSWLAAYEGQEITVEIAACNWNSKGYKGCVLAVILPDGTKVVNTLNFDQN